MLVEGTVVALALAAWYRSGKRGKLTPERESIYLQALEHLTDTTKLRTMADEYEKVGLPLKAKMLRKRADLRDLPKEKKVAYHEAYLKGMESTNIEGIRTLAKTFEVMTATGAAAKLRERADKLIQDALINVAKASEDKPTKEIISGDMVESGQPTEIISGDNSQSSHTAGTPEDVTVSVFANGAGHAH